MLAKMVTVGLRTPRSPLLAVLPTLAVIFFILVHRPLTFTHLVVQTGAGTVFPSAALVLY